MYVVNIGAATGGKDYSMAHIWRSAPAYSSRRWAEAVAGSNSMTREGDSCRFRKLAACASNPFEQVGGHGRMSALADGVEARPRAYLPALRVKTHLFVSL